MMFVGVCLSLCGQVGANYGMLVQKQSVNEDKTLGCKWWGGVLIFCVFELVSSSALFFAPTSVISSLQSVQLICNAFFAPLVIPGERLTRVTFIGCLFLLAACACSVIAYPDSKQKDLTPAELAEYFSRAWVIIMLVTLFCTFIGLSLRTYLMVNRGTPPELFSLGVLAAISATSTTICIKSLSEVTKQGGAALVVSLILATLFLSLGSFGFTNVAFKYFEALSVIPVMNSLTQVMRIIVGGLLFNEFAHMSALQAVVFFSCVTVVVVTTFLLSLFTLHEKREMEVVLGDTGRRPSLEQALTLETDEASTPTDIRSGTRMMARTLSRDFVHGMCPSLKEERPSLIMPAAQSLMMPTRLHDSHESQRNGRAQSLPRRMHDDNELRPSPTSKHLILPSDFSTYK